MNKEPFLELAHWEKEKKAIEAKIELARTLVDQEMKDNGVDKVEADYGNFYYTKRTKWTYSPAISALEEHVKAAKKVEETTNVATAVESTSLTFRATKAE